MRRRHFLGVLGGAAATWPLAAHAQQLTMPVIGFLRNTASAGYTHLTDAFRRGLAESGFVVGQDVAIEYRWADNQNNRLPELAADLIRRQVAVIVGAGAVSAKAAMTTTATTPIVMVVGYDPVKGGLVASLNRPGGNVTGVVFDTVELAAKRLGLLHELIPKTAVVGVLLDAAFLDSASEVRDAEDAGRAIGLQTLILKVSNEREIDAAFTRFVQGGVGALLVGSGGFFLSQRRQLVTLATRHAIPASYVTRQYPEAGGLMSYGPSQTDAYRLAGVYVGRILKGAKPADMPVELPTKFDLVINVATAKVLGLEIPPMLLARVDEVIE